MPIKAPISTFPDQKRFVPVWFRKIAAATLVMASIVAVPSAFGAPDAPDAGADSALEAASDSNTLPAAEPGNGNPLNAERAYKYLNQICDIGPRKSGSRGMLAQQKLLKTHFEDLGAKVQFQRFATRNPLGGANVRMANLIIRWRPELRDRVLLCAHYDTRPLPSQDRNLVARRRGRFIGANDGGSGVAVLMELAHHMPSYNGPVGIDFVLFDGEELVYDDRRDPYFLGSQWFATQYRKKKPAYKYRWGVLLDMVGDADLQIYQEVNSARWPETRPLVKQIWGTAQRLGVKEFISRVKHEVRDDHLPLRNIGRIPTCDIIDFDYPYWHTERDTARRCSGESLAKVGWVVFEWLKSLPADPAAKLSR